MESGERCPGKEPGRQLAPCLIRGNYPGGLQQRSSSDGACSHQRAARGKKESRLSREASACGQALALSCQHVFQGHLSGSGEVVAPVSPAQASFPNIKNICLPACGTQAGLSHCAACESLPLKQPGGERALEIRLQDPGDREGSDGSPTNLRADHP